MVDINPAYIVFDSANVNKVGMLQNNNAWTGINTFSDVTNLTAIQLNTTSTTTSQIGMLKWNATELTADLQLNSQVTLQIGQETLIKCVNKSGADIGDGVPVYISGAQGQRPKIGLAKGDTETTSALIGLTTQAIANNLEGFVSVRGLVRGIQTNGANYGQTWVDGDRLWVSLTTAGTITNVQPSAPNHCDEIGFVVNANPSNGEILVQTRGHRALSDLSDVNGTTLTTTGQFPMYSAGTSRFDFDYNFFRQKVNVKTTTYTLTSLDQVVVFNTATTCTANLPAATGTGHTYRIVCRAGTLTVDGDSGETIKGETTQTLYPGEDLIITDIESGKWE